MYLLLNLTGSSSITHKIYHAYIVNSKDKKKSAKIYNMFNVAGEDVNRLLQGFRADVLDCNTGLIEYGVTDFSKYKSKDIDNLIVDTTVKTRRNLAFVNITASYLSFINMIEKPSHIPRERSLLSEHYDGTVIAEYTQFIPGWTPYNTRKKHLEFAVADNGVPYGIRGDIPFYPLDAFDDTMNNFKYWNLVAPDWDDYINILELYDLIITPFIPYILKYNMTSIAYYGNASYISNCNWIFPINKQICNFLTKYHVMKG
jgi:hypothetical protein